MSVIGVSLCMDVPFDRANRLYAAGRELQREAEVESRPMQLNDGSGDMGSSANKVQFF